jgi:hypothetical protein
MVATESLLQGVIENLRIVPLQGFEIDDLCNLSFRKFGLSLPTVVVQSIRISTLPSNLYAFVALWGSPARREMSSHVH